MAELNLTTVSHFGPLQRYNCRQFHTSRTSDATIDDSFRLGTPQNEKLTTVHSFPTLRSPKMATDAPKSKPEPDAGPLRRRNWRQFHTSDPREAKVADSSTLFIMRDLKLQNGVELPRNSADRSGGLDTAGAPTRPPGDVEIADSFTLQTRAGPKWATVSHFR